MRAAAPVIPVITSLLADVVPVRELAIRRWYSASSRWYYHRRAMPAEINADRKFYQMIDPHLRELCRWLHRAGIHTTPSCQGHFYGRDHYQRVWDQLEREESLIRSSGLHVVDSSTGSQFCFRASTFELPWLHFREFFDEVSQHQTQGYLGILLPRHHHALICCLHNHALEHERAWIQFDGELSCILGGSLFGVHVTARDPDDCERLWQAVSDHLRTILEECVQPEPINRLAAYD